MTLEVVRDVWVKAGTDNDNEEIAKIIFVLLSLILSVRCSARLLASHHLNDGVSYGRATSTLHPLLYNVGVAFMLIVATM